jgi:hypothetical protein
MIVPAFLAPLAFSVAMLADGSSTAPAPPAPLKEIGRVHSVTPFCSKIVEHADSAITTALENDARIAFTIANLKTIDLDSSAVHKSNGSLALLKQYTAMHEAAVTAQGQVKLLRADAATATDPDQKARLKEFADALGGAIERQRKMADQLGRYIAYVDSHASFDDTAKAQYLFDVQWAQTAYHNPFHGDPQDYVPPSLSDAAKSAASELTTEQPAIANDEATAATRAEPAFKGCL